MLYIITLYPFKDFLIAISDILLSRCEINFDKMEKPVQSVVLKIHTEGKMGKGKGKLYLTLHMINRQDELYSFVQPTRYPLTN